MKKGFIAYAALLSTLLFFSCKKDSVQKPVVLQAKTVSNLAADTIIGLAPSGQPYGSGKFTFYSLENNTIIANTDSASNKWDIAFRGTTIITNSGTSGSGSGGAFIYAGLFSDLTFISTDSTFKTDNAPAAYAIKTGSGNGWYSYNGAVNLITPIPGRVLVIRTATGKYAKIEILNYYKGGITPDASASDNDKLTKQRYYTFRFLYQPDGTRKF